MQIYQQSYRMLRQMNQSLLRSIMAVRRLVRSEKRLRIRRTSRRTPAVASVVAANRLTFLQVDNCHNPMVKGWY